MSIEVIAAVLEAAGVSNNIVLGTTAVDKLLPDLNKYWKVYKTRSGNRLYTYLLKTAKGGKFVHLTISGVTGTTDTKKSGWIAVIYYPSTEKDKILNHTGSLVPHKPSGRISADFVFKDPESAYKALKKFFKQSPKLAASLKRP